MPNLAGLLLSIFLFYSKFVKLQVIYYPPQGYDSSSITENPFRAYYDTDGYLITPLPDETKLATERLGEMESQVLNDSIEHFLMTKKERINTLLANIEKLKQDITSIQQALKKVDKSGKQAHHLTSWLEKKKNEEKLLFEEINVLEAITLMLTELEAAKYFAFLKRKDGDFVKDIFNDATHLPLQAAKKTSIELTDANKQVEERKNDQFGEMEYIDLDRKIDANNNNNLDVSRASKSDIAKALSSVSYVERVTNFDNEEVSTLVSQLKSLIVDEIAKKEELMANSQKLNELERFISKRTVYDQKARSETEKRMSNIANELVDAKKRLWVVKEMEWIITRIEAAKYLARLRKEESEQENIFKRFSSVILEK